MAWWDEYLVADTKPADDWWSDYVIPDQATKPDEWWKDYLVEPPSFTESIKRGVDIAQGMGYGAVEATGEAFDSESLTRFGRAGRIRNEAEAEQYGERPQFADIRGIGDLGQWMKETAGEQIPMMAPSLAGGLAGAGVGALIGGPVGATIGGAIGAFAPSFVLGVGEVQGAIKQKDPTAESPTAAFIGGTAIAALDTVLPGRVGSRLVTAFGRETAEEIAKRTLEKPLKDTFIKAALKEGGKGMAIEGVTEAMQEAIGEVAAAKGAGQGIDWKTLPGQMLEAGAAGALMGGGVGLATGGFTRPKDKDDDPIKKPPPRPGDPESEATRETLAAEGDAILNAVEQGRPIPEVPRDRQTRQQVRGEIPLGQEPVQTPVQVGGQEAAGPGGNVQTYEAGGAGLRRPLTNIPATAPNLPVGAQPSGTAPGQPPATPAVATPLLRRDGTPFLTAAEAGTAARSRKDLRGKGYEPVPVEGGFGLVSRETPNATREIKPVADSVTVNPPLPPDLPVAANAPSQAAAQPNPTIAPSAQPAAAVQPAATAPSQRAATYPAVVPPLRPHEGSWVVVKKGTLEAVLETFEEKTAAAINGAKYDVLTAGDYLGRKNKELASRRSTPTPEPGTDVAAPAPVAAPSPAVPPAAAGVASSPPAAATPEITIYHGSPNTFEDFDAERSKYGGASFFSTEEDVAKGFARGPNASVKRLVTKGRIFDPSKADDMDGLAAAIDENFGEWFGGALFGKQAAKGFARDGDWGVFERPEVQAWIKAQGYDGWRFREGAQKRLNSVALFNPNKSAAKFAAAPTPTVTARSEPKAKRGKRLPAFKRLISRKTGGKGVAVVRGDHAGIKYDPLIGTVSVGNDVDESEVLAAQVGRRIKGVTRKKLGDATVIMPVDDGTSEELNAADTLDDIRADLHRAYALLECVR